MNKLLVENPPESSVRVLPGRNVFISSRMVLARERDAAFKALADAGLRPLLYERERGDPSSKQIMENLLDKAHMLIVLYDGDHGTPREDLHGLSPIEYEFWRFMARLESSPNDQVPTDISNRSQIESRVRNLFTDEPEMPSLRNRFLAESLAGSGPLFLAAKERVRLVHWSSLGQRQSTCEFVRFLPAGCFICFKPPDAWKAHLDVFRSVFARFSQDILEGRISKALAPGPSDSKEPLALEVTGKVRDEPRTLLRVLQTCMQLDLDILVLQARPVEGATRMVKFKLAVVPVRRTNADSQGLNELLNNQTFQPLQGVKKRLIKLADCKKAYKTHNEINIHTDDKVHGSAMSKDILMLVINFLDVPGALWEIVSIINRHKLNGKDHDILSLDVLIHGEQKVVTLRLRVPKPARGSQEETNRAAELRGLAYELHTAACVVGAACHGDLEIRCGPPIQGS